MGYRIRPLSAAIALVFAGGLPQFALAQSRGTPVLDEIVVQSAREQVLLGGQSVGATNIQALRAATSDTASLLRDVPGVSLYGAGGTTSLPVIHGLADDRLRISVDGMDFIASCPNHMNPPLGYLDPNNTRRLTVYTGVSPVSVGGDSIGGSIVAETAEPQFAAAGQGVLSKGEVGGFYRGNGHAMGANAAATVATESFSVSYTGATAKSDNYKAAKDFKTFAATGNNGRTLALNEVGSSAYETNTHTLGMAMKGGNHLLEAKIGYQSIPQQLYPNQRMDMLDNEQKRINLRYLGLFDWGSFEARAFHEEVNHRMDFGPDKRYWYGSLSGSGAPCSPIRFAGDPAGTCAAGMPMNTSSRTSGLKLKADIDLGKEDLLRIGSLYQQYTLNDWWPASGGGMGPNTFQNINDGKRDRLGVFGEWEKRFSPEWQSLLGLRYEQVDTRVATVQGYSAMMMNQMRDATNLNNAERNKTDHNWDMTALARYTLDANRDLEFGVARKVRSPNLYERYSWSTAAMMATMNNFVGDGNGYVGNPDLRSEKAYTASASFDWHAADRRWEARATPFITYVNDYIDAVQWNAATNVAATTLTRNQFAVLKYTNQSARLYGLDLSGRMPLAQTELGEFAVKGLINYTRGENRDTHDNLYNIMPLNAKLVLTQQKGNWDNAVEWIGMAGKKNVSDVRNEIQTSGYSLVNLRASYSWKQARVDLGVENLFDRYYVQPLGGAYSGQGTTMSINGIPWGIGVPGMGRTAYAGFNLKF